MSLLEFLQNLHPHSDNYIATEEGYILNIKRPERLLEIPEISEKIPNHTVLNLDYIKNYFQFLHNDNICQVNHHPKELNLHCDYCRYPIFNLQQDAYYFCNLCKLYMCKLCHEETSEEKAISNGAQNWKKRKDKLSECRQQELQ